MLSIIVDDLTHFSLYFHQAGLMMFDLSIQNVQPNFGYFLNATAIQSFVFCLWHHNRRFLSMSLVSKAGLSRLKQNLLKILYSVQSASSLGCDDCRMN
jgi:hypothetical protein